MAGSRRKSVVWDTISTGIALGPDVRSGTFELKKAAN